MSSIKHKYDSSVERHMVWGLILTQVVLRFCCPVRIHTRFYTDITGENTSSKHERYMRNVANRTLSLTLVYYLCFSFFELMFRMLATRDKQNFLHVKTQDLIIWCEKPMGNNRNGVHRILCNTHD